MFKYVAPVLCLLIVLGGCISGTTVRQSANNASPLPSAQISPGASVSTSPSPSPTVGITVSPPTPAQNSTVTFNVTGPLSTAFNVTVNLPTGALNLAGTTDSTGAGSVATNVGPAGVGLVINVILTFASGQTATTSFTVAAASPTPTPSP